MAEENIIKFKIKTEDNALRSTKNQIKELKAAMLEAEDTATFNKLALEAGRLETEVKRTEDAVRSLAGSGSELTKMSTSFSRVGSSLASMDFAAAAEEAGRLAAISKSMNFGTAISSLKSLGSTFMSLGKALLTNPFFLLVGVIVAIGVALYKLMDELGIITAIFEAVGDAIGWVIQQLKDLLDWFGLTDYAGEEQADNTIKRNDEIVDSIKKVQAATTASIDHEIAMRRIAGEDATDLERHKLKMIKASLKAQIAEADKKAKALIKLHGGDSEEVKAQMQAIKDLGIAFRASSGELIQFEAKVVADSKAKVEKDNTEKLAKQKAYAEAQKKIQEDILNAQLKADEMIAKAKIEFIEDDIERARQMAIFNENQAFKSIDLKILTNEQKETLEQQHQQKLIDIEKEAVDKRIEIQKKESNEALTEQKRKQALWNETLLESFKAEVDARQMLKDATFNIANDTVGLLTAVAGKNKIVADIAFAAEKAAAIAGVIVNTQKEIASYAANPTWSLLPDGGAAIKSAMTIKAKVRAGISIATIAATSVGKFMNGGSAGGVDSGGGASFAPPSLGGRQDTTPSMNLNNGVEQNAGGSVNRVTVVDYTDIQDKGTQLNRLQNRVSLV